nr:isoleucine--tRNA ligase [Pyrinomonadaceae bacterium]
TTPWTLPANLGIAVNPNFEYAAMENGDEVYIIARELAESVAQKCGIGEPRIIATFPGSRLDRLEARHAWLDRPSLLMLGEHVTLGGEADAETELDVKEARDKSATAKGAGTGCVHTAPGHGHDDFVIGGRYGLDIYCPVDSSGRFAPDVEHFASERVFDANPKIVEFLKASGALLFSEEYRHRYPHCWRCKNPVIFRATPQWFISLDARGRETPTELDEDGRVRTNFTDNETDAPMSLREGALREVERVEWVPAWGAERMRNMLKNRPDWCVSRQRVWGVPIPVFYCADCGVEVADPQVIDHVAGIFERESADAWYAREAKDLLPENFACPNCKGAEFTKETDILDVWFDSGSSSIAVLEHYAELRWPADMYLEGGDQYRGWFNSSLMVGLAAHDAAPYKTVLTHGWVVDGQGKAMHKSAGNAVSPNDVIKQSGAEILRLWCASSDYHEDMRCSEEILQRVADGYRKLRNTARFALGNLDGFAPARDSVPTEEMQEIDRWALAELDAVTERVIAGYDAYEFHTVYHALYNFCTVTLSARYFDIIKDRLYTAAPKSHARRSAQTALYRIADALARLLAPILVFTADEIWENLPSSEGEGTNERPVSVHLAEFPAVAGALDKELLKSWADLFEIRELVLRKLEAARNQKIIGSSLEAHVKIAALGKTYELLEQHRQELPTVFIVSQVSLSQVHTAEDSSPSPINVSVLVERAKGKKCERCWKYSEHTVELPRYGGAVVCERCAAVLAEMEGDAA